MPRNSLEQINKASKSETVSFSELGVSGLSRFGGLINEEWLHELDDLYRSNKIYKEMRDNDPIIGAILFASEMYVRRVKWFVKPGGVSQKALEKADFLESNMQDFKDQNFNDIISEILSFLPFGWSICEKVYRIRKKDNTATSSKYNDGKVGWSRFGFRAQETLREWVYHPETSELKGLIQTDPITGKDIFIPIEKLMLFRTKIYKDNPQGRSVFRNAFVPWWYKKHLQEFEAIGLEHSATGVVVGWVPVDIITNSTKSALKAAIGDAIVKIQTGKGGAILLPLQYDVNGNKMYDISLLQGNSNSSEIAQIGVVIERYDTRIAQSCLYDIVMIGNSSKSSGGSYALAENKSNNFVLALSNYLEIIKAKLNDDAVRDLFRLNGDDMEELPTIEFTPIIKADLKEVGEYLKALAAAGATLWPNKALSKWLMVLANMPEQEDEEIEEILHPKDEDTQEKEPPINEGDEPNKDAPDETTPKDKPVDAPEKGGKVAGG